MAREMEFDDITRTDDEQPAVTYPSGPSEVPPKPSLLPWILLFVTVAVSIGTTLFLWRRTAEETERANRAYVDKAQAELRATQAESQLEGQKQRVLEMVAEQTTWSNEKQALELKVKALEAKLPPEKGATASKGKPAGKVAKKPVKKKKKRR